MPYCRVAPSLGSFEGDPNDVWGTLPYNPKLHYKEPTVFFGLYGLPDFYELWRHEGKKWVLWAGSDIRHFVNGYWLEDGGSIKIDGHGMAKWINKNCENWVENEVEQEALEKIGISSQVCPSFLGNVNDYQVTYKPSDRPQLYTSVSGDDFGLYGWQKINVLAGKHPDIEFHYYGNTKSWKAHTENMIVHGRMPKEQMNAEIQQMQGSLRMVAFDGFSEIIAKSVLWGQWPISLIKYPHVFNSIPKVFPKNPNFDGRNHFLSTLNKYPWNEND